MPPPLVCLHPAVPRTKGCRGYPCHQMRGRASDRGSVARIQPLIACSSPSRGGTVGWAQYILQCWVEKPPVKRCQSSRPLVKGRRWEKPPKAGVRLGLHYGTCPRAILSVSLPAALCLTHGRHRDPLCPGERPQQREPQPTLIFFPGKRPAPARPTMPPPPPVAQPRTTAPTPAAPEHVANPKAQPRRMAGVPSRPPSVPPPLPPQPARRHSRDAPPSPKPPAGEADAATTTDCAPGATDEGQPLPAGGISPSAALPPEEN